MSGLFNADGGGLVKLRVPTGSVVRLTAGLLMGLAPMDVGQGGAVQLHPHHQRVTDVFKAAHIR